MITRLDTVMTDLEEEKVGIQEQLSKEKQVLVKEHSDAAQRSQEMIDKYKQVELCFFLFEMIIYYVAYDYKQAFLLPKIVLQHEKLGTNYFFGYTNITNETGTHI